MKADAELEALLRSLRERGVALWLDGDRLGVRAPKGSLSEELRRGLAEHKEGLLAMLRAGAQHGGADDDDGETAAEPAAEGASPARPRWLFAHSYRDAWLVGLSVLELALVVALAAGFAVLPWPVLAAGGALAVVLSYMNHQCMGHNFIHTPYFKSAWLNAAYSVLNTLAMGNSQTLHRAHHLNHHQYNNRVGGGDKAHATDHSSIYLHSREPGVAENFWRYALLSPVRGELAFLLAKVRKHGQGRRLAAELVALGAFWLALLAWDWKFFVLLYAPVWYLGEAVAYAENYREHYKAHPGNRLADSVSCYGRLYNLLCFNNGYHQEHHYRPQTHWTRMETLRAHMLPEPQRRVVRVAHWFNT